MDLRRDVLELRNARPQIRRSFLQSTNDRGQLGYSRPRLLWERLEERRRRGAKDELRRLIGPRRAAPTTEASPEKLREALPNLAAPEPQSRTQFPLLDTGW